MPSFLRLGAVRFLFGSLLFSCGNAQPPGRDVAKLYQELCSSCHGANLEGGKGNSLVDGRWKHGGDHPSLIRSIREGYPDDGMPAFLRRDHQ